MVPGFKQKNGGVAVLSSEIKGCLESEGESEHGSGLNMWCRKGSFGSQLGHQVCGAASRQDFNTYKIEVHRSVVCDCTLVIEELGLWIV